ncbi:MAG: PspC domain-containing protein [bacterium]
MKKLYRNSNNVVIGGVCSGLGEYFNIDPVIIRVVFLLGLFSVLPFGLTYLALWILTPEK